jgi:hypothetical protein
VGVDDRGHRVPAPALKDSSRYQDTYVFAKRKKWRLHVRALPPLPGGIRHAASAAVKLA